MAEPDTQRSDTRDAAPAGRAAEPSPGAGEEAQGRRRRWGWGRMPRPQDAPDKPTKLKGTSWFAAVVRTVREFGNDFLQDRAASLTYYGIMSIFPALLVLVSLIGLVSKSATNSLVNSLTTAIPGSAQTIITNAVHHLQQQHATAGILAIVGLVLGVWSASGYVAAFMRASNAIYDVPEGRPWWKTIPTRIGVTVVVLVLLVISAVIVVMTGGLAQRVGHALGIGPVAVLAWDIAKWPVLLVLVSLMFAILYWASPNARQGFRWVSPGGVLAVVLWLIASGGFALYVANFGHYNKVYGSLAGVIIFLIWMWISNVAILLGAEFNAELQRGRAIAGGVPPDAEPFAELRDDRKLRKKKSKRRGLFG